jgi:hypothetical protein
VSAKSTAEPVAWLPTGISGLGGVAEGGLSPARAGILAPRVARHRVPDGLVVAEFARVGDPAR